MKFRIKTKGTPASPSNIAPTAPLAPAQQTAQAGAGAQPNPRSIPNPYGRLFTKDKSFADLLPKQQGTKTE